MAVYPTDSSVFAYPYFRYTFQVSGFDEHHNQYFLAISFDAADTLHLANEYSSKYTNKGGLHEVTLYKIDSLQRIQSFSLKTDTADNLFAIDRQGINVRFLSGNFHFLLRNDQDTSEYLYIKQGSFQDIAY
ncbi:MAG: hypothetical protein IRZ29_07430 [Thermoflavifilum sp.]|nr:hypothetical protein [Thermoflavifilum sp.]